MPKLNQFVVRFSQMTTFDRKWLAAYTYLAVLSLSYGGNTSESPERTMCLSCLAHRTDYIITMAPKRKRAVLKYPPDTKSNLWERSLSRYGDVLGQQIISSSSLTQDHVAHSFELCSTLFRPDNNYKQRTFSQDLACGEIIIRCWFAKTLKQFQLNTALAVFLQ